MLIRPLKIASDETDEASPLSAMDRRITPRLITRARVLLAALVMVATATAAYSYVRFGLTRSVSVEAARLSIATVQRAVFHDYIPVTGNVVPRTTVYLDAVTGGQVAETLVEEGAKVTAGQPLVMLNNINLQLEVMGREAALAQQLYQLTTINQSIEDRRLQRARELTEIEFQISTLSAELARKEPLLADGYVARKDIDEMKRSLTRYQSLHENVLAAQTTDAKTRPGQAAQLSQSIDLITNNLAFARRNLEALTITAPVDGQLTSLDAEIGAAKTPGQRIGQIDSTDGFKVRANIDEFYLARVMPGQPAAAEIGGQSYALEIAKIYPGVTERQFAVDLIFTGAAPAVRRGQTLHLKLEIGEAGDSLTVANGAFYDDSGGQWVFAVSPSGTAVRRPVALGRRNPDRVEVLSGLEAGDRVIVSAYGPYLKFDRIDIRGALGEGAYQP